MTDRAACRDMALLSLATLAILVAVDVLTGTGISTSFGLAPLIASIAVGARGTAGVAAAASAAALAAGLWDGRVGTLDWWLRAFTCGIIGGVSVLSAASRTRRESRLRQMTMIAKVTQRAVLGTMPPELGPVRLAARYISASAEALIGGDLYEVAETPYGVRVIVGDVKGKGLDAVQIAASTLGGFRLAAFTRAELSDVAADLDGMVCRTGGDEDFVTAVLTEYRSDGTVRVVNCGHHPPLLVLPDGTARVLDTGDPDLPLGMGPQNIPTDHEWPVGSRMLHYTDGLVEARDPAGAFFPLEQHSKAILVGTPTEALDVLVGRLLKHAGSLNDDMALVLAERT